MPRTSEPGRSVSSRLLDVLFSFEPGHTELSLADLARRTGLPHPTARRLVLELTRAGALEQRPDGRFAVGLRLWRLGTLAPLTESLRSSARPFMKDLHAALHQYVQLAVLDGDAAVVIERLPARATHGLVAQVGGRLPLHCSGVGKVLLGHGGPGLLGRVLGGRLRRYTPRTITDADALRRELAECRRTGTAVARGELVEGVDSVATRIMNADGRVVASLSVDARSGSVPPHTVLASVITSGLALSRTLGWQPGVRARAGGEG